MTGGAVVLLNKAKSTTVIVFAAGAVAGVAAVVLRSPALGLAAGAAMGACAVRWTSVEKWISSFRRRLPASEAPSQQPVGTRQDLMDDLLALLREVDIFDDQLKSKDREMERERAESRQLATHLRALTDAARRAAAEETQEPVLRRMIDEAHSSYGAVGVELWLQSGWRSSLPGCSAGVDAETPQGELVHLTAVSGWDAADSSLEHAKGAPVLGVVDSCARLTTSDASSLRWLFDAKWVDTHAIHSFAAMPLAVRGESIGVLAVFSREPLTDIFLGVLECYTQILALAIANTRNITASRVTAAKLEAAHQRQEEINQQLTEADRLKSEFLATVSHELRTPLNAILGFLNLIRQGLCESPEEQEEFVTSAHASAEHLMVLINHLLSLSEIESGRARLDVEEVPIDRVLVRCLDKVRASAEAKGLQLQGAPMEETLVLADAARLEQILDGLLDNAVKFTPSGSVHVEVVREGNVCRLRVRDTGIGIAPEECHRLFQKFQQLDGSTTRQFGGTGLGLSLTRGLAQLMGGNITLESPGENQGTVATLSLPLAGTQADASHGLPEDAPLVLIVEDDAQFAHYLRHLLLKGGYNSVLAPSTDEARAELRRRKPALVSLDWALGQGGEISNTGRLLRDLCTRVGSPPVVVVTGYGASVREFMDRENIAGDPPVLVKPVDPEEYLQVVEDLTSQQKQAAA